MDMKSAAHVRPDPLPGRGGEGAQQSRPLDPRLIDRLRARLVEIERQFAALKRQIDEQRQVLEHCRH